MAWSLVLSATSSRPDQPLRIEPRNISVQPAGQHCVLAWFFSCFTHALSYIGPPTRPCKYMPHRHFLLQIIQRKTTSLWSKLWRSSFSAFWNCTLCYYNVIGRPEKLRGDEKCVEFTSVNQPNSSADPEMSPCALPIWVLLSLI